MADLVMVLTMLVVFGGLGLPIAYLLPERFRWRPLVAPTLGIAIAAVLAPISYRLGLRVPFFFIALVVLAAGGLAWRGRRALRELRAHPRREWLAVAIAWVACTLLLLAPRWIGGDQFAVFQGNPWDTFGYLESAISYARKSYDSLQNVTDAQISRFQMFSIARQQLGERPSVHLLYATFSRVMPGQAYHLYYAFLVFFFSQLFATATFVVRSLVPSARPNWWFAIAACFPLGFWGQYVFDINAWSHVAASPLLFLLFGLVIHVAVGECSWRTTMALSVLVAGCTYVYPEAFIIHAAAVYFIAGAFALGRMIRARRFEPRALIPFASLAAAASVVLYPALLHFVMKQVAFGKGTIVPWWQYFQAFFAGRDGVWGSGFSRDADFASASVGLYFVTPRADGALAFALRLVSVAGLVALIAAVVALCTRKPTDDNRETRGLAIAWALATLVMVVPAIMLYRAHNYWPAGKAWSYAAAPLVTLLALPAALRSTGPWRLLRWVSIVFIAVQVAGAAIRIAAVAKSPDGIHYASPYPAVTTPGMKREIGWDLTGLEPYLTKSTRVVVKPTHMWLEHGLMVFLFSRHVPYAKLSLPNTYFGDGTFLDAPPVPWQPDIELSVEGKEIVLHFTDGRRPDVRVVSGSDLR